MTLEMLPPLASVLLFNGNNDSPSRNSSIRNLPANNSKSSSASKNSLPTSSQYSFTVHNYNTRNVSNQGLYIPSINTTAFGNISLRYNTPVVWNKLLKTNPEISNSVSMNSLKYTLKSYYLKTYSALLLIN